MLIAEIYHKNPVTINENESIKTALQKLIEQRFNDYIVVNDKDVMVGILSLQDIAGATVPKQFRDNIRIASAMYRKGFFKERCELIKDRKVKDLMRRDFIQVSLEDNIMSITADFLKNDLYIVPVVEKGELIGIVTRSEIKKALAAAMEIITHKEKEI